MPDNNNNPPPNNKLSKLLLIFGLVALLCVEGYFGYRLHILSAQQEQLKTDYSEVNSITRGLLSVAQWKDQVTGIVHRQVRRFELTKKERRVLQKEVESVLLAVIKKAEAMVEKKPKSLGGKIRRLIVKKFVKPEKVRAQVPRFAQKIIAQVDNPRQKARLSNLTLNKFDDLQHSPELDSALKSDRILFDKMQRKYQASSPDDLNRKLDQRLKTIRKDMYADSLGMLACIVVVLLLWWWLRKQTALHSSLFILSLPFAFILLAVGLSASMIEVDARIPELDFVLLGEHVTFRDQVLFYQSKSILDVVHVLITQSAVDSIAVGVLILGFSILFPVLKLTSTGIHLLSKRKIAESKFICYFAFQSGKWSMADVIVIAVLMAYVGLNGLLDKQLALLNLRSADLTILTTNNTALQPGYIIFISFVLYGLILSTILKYITPHRTHA